jgi:hypothetical protein
MPVFAGRAGRQTYPITQIVGMNTTDPETSLPPGQVRLVENVDLLLGGLGEKRAGFSDGPVGANQPQGAANTDIVALFRHVPNGEENGAELWAVIRPTAPGVLGIRRFAAGVWSNVTLNDVADWTNGETWSFATFNRKLFIAYDSAVNRLHVWDGTSVRRVGLAPPAVAPGLANIGAGALTFNRWYRVRFRSGPGTPVTQLISEASPPAFIGVAASSGVRVTRPALVDGIEQSWDIEAASAAAGPWFTIALGLPIGTLFSDDTSATITTVSPAPEAGIYQLPPSAKYLSVFLNQVVMAGAWETTSIAGQTVPQNNRVWYTRPLHTFDISDDEAIPSTLTSKFWTDVGEDNDRVNGLSYPVFGMPYVTKRRQFWALNPTDDVAQPFRAVRITDSVGCRDYRTICIGEDERGDPALYWNSLRGPYRLTRGGMQYLGRDLELNAELVLADRAVWVADRRQIWWVRAISGFFPYVFNVRFGRPTDNGDVRNGWTAYSDIAADRLMNALCVFGEGFSTTADRLLPVTGGRTIGAIQSYLWQFDPFVDSDVGTAYRGLIRSGQITLGDLFYNVSVYPPRIYGAPRNQTALLQWTLFRNLTNPANEAPQVSTVSLLQTFGPPVFKNIGTFEGIGQSDGEVFQYELGDVAAAFQGWRLFAAVIPYQRQEEAE